MQYQDSERRVTMDMTNFVEIMPNDPSRVVVTLAWPVGPTQPLEVRFHGTGPDYFTMWVTAGSFTHLEYNKYGLLVTMRAEAFSAGGVDTVSVYELKAR